MEAKDAQMIWIYYGRLNVVLVLEDPWGCRESGVVWSKVRTPPTAPLAAHSHVDPSDEVLTMASKVLLYNLEVKRKGERGVKKGI